MATFDCTITDPGPGAFCGVPQVFTVEADGAAEATRKALRHVFGGTAAGFTPRHPGSDLGEITYPDGSEMVRGAVVRVTPAEARALAAAQWSGPFFDVVA